MIDKHKRLLPPCNKGFTTHLESMYNTSFTLVGTSGLAPCRLGVPRPMSFYMSKLSGSIPFHINKRSSSFYYGKNTGYQFIWKFQCNCPLESNLNCPPLNFPQK